MPAAGKTKSRAPVGIDEIAAALVVSGATVKTHVNRVLGKLGLCSRVQAVVLGVRDRAGAALLDHT